VLARVGGRAITAEEFLDVARASRNQYPMVPDSAKRLLLDDMIRRELMLCEAEQQGLSRDTAISSIRRNAEEDLIMGVLSDQLATRNVPVSDAEIAAFYLWRKTEHHLEAIHTTHAAIAADASARIAAGELFEAVAAQLNVSGVVPPSGDLGFIPGGAVPEPLVSRMREAPIGEVFGPLPVGSDAWFLARVIERRPAELPPQELVRDQLIQQLRQRKHRSQVQRSIESLRSDYRLRLEPGGAQELFARAAGMTDPSAEPRPDHTIVLARYLGPRGDTVFTVADAMREVESVADGPDFTSVPAIQRWLESHVMRRIVLAEARRRHLHEEPQTANRIEDRVDGILLQTIYDREVSMRVTINDDELREEYLMRAQGQNVAPFEQVPAGLREQLRSMAMELKRDRLLQQFTDALRRKYPVKVDEAVFRRLQWPPPSLELPQQG